MDDVAQICARLREERLRLGLNQQDFAESTGVSRKTQSAYESGASAPDVAYLKIAASLGVDVHYVISGRREGSPIDGHVEIQALAGFGPADGPSTILLPDFLLQQKIGMTSAANVRWALNPSRAMEPEIERHQLVLVDVTQSTLADVIDGTTYAYTLWGRPDIRRVLHRRDHWSVVGFGKGAESTDVYKDDQDSLQILGAVVGAV
ncbi:helix-turn-helix domain-containing protein [Lysobacter cavernae]|uniref:Helix-turn-helix domain-containing protein n=1 Tax=Lysobacter cavernae TaxID=1685901 RepID=A0ABV7RK17_9GAMM